MLRAGFFKAIALLLTAFAVIKSPVSLFVVVDEAKRLQSGASAKLKKAHGSVSASPDAAAPLVLVDLSCE